MSTDVDNNNNGELLNPLVFSCLQCRTIIGDSYNLNNSDEMMKTITLLYSINIKRSNKLYTSNDNYDNGSTYYNITCSNCDKLLGRYYITTSYNLDYIREKFTYYIDNITSYELGCNNNDNNKANTNNNPQEIDNIASNTDFDNSVITDLQDDVLKVQHVLVDLAQRIKGLEEKVLLSHSHQDNVSNNTDIANNNDMSKQIQLRKRKDNFDQISTDNNDCNNESDPTNNTRKTRFKR